MQESVTAGKRIEIGDLEYRVHARKVRSAPPVVLDELKVIATEAYASWSKPAAPAGAAPEATGSPSLRSHAMEQLGCGIAVLALLAGHQLAETQAGVVPITVLHRVGFKPAEGDNPCLDVVRVHEIAAAMLPPDALPAEDDDEVIDMVIDVTRSRRGLEWAWHIRFVNDKPVHVEQLQDL